MDRSRLALLIGIALLATGIRPFPSMPNETASPRIVSAGTHSITSANDAKPQDSEIIRDLEKRMLATNFFVRLSRRHTGLSERELRRVAETIVIESVAQGLDPDIVIAVIEVESAGYPLAVSRVGAMGLMQLLPSTAEELCRKHGIVWKGSDTLFDPLVNIKLGTTYLQELAKRYDNDVHIALAAYNWGPGRIDRRIRRGATIPTKYVNQVMRAYDRPSTLATRRI